MTEPWWAGSPVGPAPGAPGGPTAQPQRAPWAPPPGVRPPTSGPATSSRPPSPSAQPWMPQPTRPPQLATQQQPGAPGPSGPTSPGGPVRPGQPGPQQSTEPWVVGLGILGFLLVVAALAFVGVIAVPWFQQWAVDGDACYRAGGGWECFVNDTWHSRLLLPVVAMLAAFSLARGAGVERKQRRPIGYLYALLGFAVLGVAWTIGAAA